MKKLISALCITALTWASTCGLAVQPGLAAALPNELQGVPYYRELIQNGTFNDTGYHWAAEALYIAGVNGLLKADASGNANPDAPLSKKDALLGIAQMSGWMPQIQSGGQGRIPANMDPWTYYGQQVLTVAAGKGLFGSSTGAGGAVRPRPITGNWDDPATREEMILWTSRALQLPSTVNGSQTGVYNYQDWNQLAPDSVPWIEAALQQGLISASNGNGRPALRPKDKITRAEGAVILTRALPKALILQARPIMTANVYDIDEIGEGPGNAAQRRIHLVSAGAPQGQKSTLFLQGPSQDNPSGQSIALWKDGPADGNALQPGDQIELYPVAGTGTSSQAARSGSSDALNAPYKVPAPDASGFGSTTIVYFAKVLPTGVPVEGTLLNYDPNSGRVLLQDSWGNQRQATVIPGARIFINGVEHTLADVPNGTFLRGSLSGNTLSSLSTELSVAQPGAIPTGSNTLTGRVKSIDANGLRLLTSTGQEQYYPFAPGLQVYEGRQIARPVDIKIGDPVTLHMDDFRGLQIARVDLPTVNRLNEGIYRGTVDFINPVTRIATLHKAYKFNTGNWESLPGQLQVRLDSSTAVSVNGSPTTGDDFIRYGTGQDILFSASQDLAMSGRPSGVYTNFDTDDTTTDYKSPGTSLGLKASRLSVIQGSGERLNDKIEKIDLPGRTVRMSDDGSTFAFDGATIVIRNGRLVDPAELQSGDPVIAYTDASRYGYRASLIVVDKDLLPSGSSLNSLASGLVQGDLREVSTDRKVKLALYSQYRNNSWSSFDDGTTTFKVDYDTVVYDVRGASLETIPIADFMSEGPADLYDGSYVYAFIEDNRALAVVLSNDAPATNHPPQDSTILARVKSITQGTQSNIIVFDQIRQWSDRRETWVSDPTTNSLNVDNSVFIKNDKLIDIDGLRVGDTCLVIRDGDNEQARFIIKQ
ncbi:hypothetical protein GJ688_11475 [Heliobacillus mobilis]|uniref:SLH domain-containing protein n=1 Tax=Heliobacterium mobile TaxID=28064 RepID=A0A6I3SMM1_HELMO|nr:hypothetical protein [Heliobacterium mobile]MTV49597.1 hypothetical protein [Heliobacterium mobile]